MQSFIGTGMIVGIATLISVPLGVLTRIYLSEYGKGRTAAVVRFVAEMLLSTPSIVAGAFIWALVVVALGNFSALAGGLSPHRADVADHRARDARSPPPRPQGAPRRRARARVPAVEA